MMRIALLSDIHSAAGAYSTALEAARSEGFDLLVLLGDLLTYGPDPERTLEITKEAAEKHDLVLIEGNHDQIYLNALDGGGGGGGHGSGWIAESIDWTKRRIDLAEFAGFDWRSEFVLDDLLFAHANPYPFGDWTYLRTDDEFRSAAETLSSRGFRYGIFGHSHRHSRFDNGSEMAMTVGSVGQPRSRSDKCSQWAMVTIGQGRVEVDVRMLDFDWRAHCDAIRSTSLTQSTKERLCEFFQ